MNVFKIKIILHMIFFNGKILFCILKFILLIFNRFATEQIQEESLVKDIIDRLNLIGDDKIGMYTFDRDIMNFRKENQTP